MSDVVRTLCYLPYFARAIRRHIGRDSKHLLCMVETLLLMVQDPRNPALETHALRGSKKGLLSCSCGYDCRIIFRLDPGKKSGEQDIVLIDVGTHDEVY